MLPECIHRDLGHYSLSSEPQISHDGSLSLTRNVQTLPYLCLLLAFVFLFFLVDLVPVAVLTLRFYFFGFC